MNTNTVDNLYVGPEARTKLTTGINKVCDAVKLTLGAKGQNALIQILDFPYTLPTSDGITIIESIKLSDPIEQMGADLVKENSGRHNRASGDGSTSAAVLLQAILQEAEKVTDVAPIEIMDSLNEALSLVLKAIDDQTKEITVNEVGQIASIAARDEKIGALIQEIYTQIGKDGILYPDVSKTFEDHYTIGKGVKIDGAGFISPYMADLGTDTRFTNTAQFKNAHILITKQKLSSASELNDIAAYLFSKEIKELVVFADEIEGAVIPDLIRTRAEKGFRIVVVKMPVLWKDWWFEDLAKMTGATIIDPIAGVTFKTAKYEHLGRIDNITVDKTDTYLDGIKDITDYLKQLEDNGDDNSKIRMARLNTKTARLFVGAHSDAMLSYRRLRVEDARNSAYMALQSGIVAGGGVALLDVSNLMPDSVGGRILKKALQATIKQIIANCGLTPLTERTWWFRQPKKTVYIGGDDFAYPNGYNARTGEIVDMFDAGICDAASVVKSSITNALSVASIVLTAPIIIPLQEK